MRTIRVLEVLASGAIGGGTTHLLSLVERVDPQAFPLSVVCSSDGPLLTELSRQGITTYQASLRGCLNLQALPELVRAGRSWGADLIHAHGTRAGLVSGLAAKSLGIPLAYTAHGWSFHPRSHPTLELAAETIEHQICRFATRVICVSRADCQEGIRRGLIAQEQAQIIYNGVSPEAYRVSEEARWGCRSEFGLSQELVVSLFGRLTRQKGHRTLLVAAKRLLERIPDIRFLLVGEGEERPALESLVRELGIFEQVIFAGARRDVPELLAASDICVLPSLWEGLPICLLEAMAAERPVVASAVNGNVEVVHHGKTGFLVPPQDPGILSEYLGLLLTDPELRYRFGLAGRQRVEACFRIEHMIRDTEKLYRTIGEKPQ